MADDLRAIDVEETAAWEATPVPLRSGADALAFDNIGYASHHFAKLVDALRTAGQQPGNEPAQAPAQEDIT